MEKPIIAQKGPFVLDNEPKTYFWCTCGKSSKQPFCDGSHKGSVFTPLKTIIEKQGENAWCGCKHTSNPPFCDGSHNKL